MTPNEEDKRLYLVKAAKAALYQCRLLINALVVLTPEPKQAALLQNILLYLDATKNKLNELYR